MENRRFYALLLWLGMAGQSGLTAASSRIEDSFAMVEATTQMGLVISAKAEGERLVQLRLELAGEVIDFDQDNFADLHYPELGELATTVDSQLIDGQVYRIVSIPFMAYKEVENVTLVIRLSGTRVIGATAVNGDNLHSVIADLRVKRRARHARR